MEKKNMLDIQSAASSAKGTSLELMLLRKMLEEDLDKIQPVLNPSSDYGYAYPEMETFLNLTAEQVQAVLDALAAQKVLDKQLFTSFLSCPQCNGSSLKSVLGCPQCESDKVYRGRILEHFFCGNVSLEDKYIAGGRYICPKCKGDVRYLGTDYRSIGVKYSCSNCGNIFDQPVALRQCPKCNSFFLEEKAVEHYIYGYSLSAKERARLGFEFGSKQRLVNFLQRRGYSVTENARISTSKSGEEHVFDLLGSRYDGFIEYSLCIDCIIDPEKEISLDDVFKYDAKTYDLGIHDKILLVMPCLGEKASRFAQKQRIMVYTEQELLDLLQTNLEAKLLPSTGTPSVFHDKEELIDNLRQSGYLVKEKAQLRGRSGVLHEIDLYARLDDGLISHTVDIGILEGMTEVNLDRVMLFDAVAFDIGVHDKILITSARLDQDASKFAEQQRIKVYKFAKKQ